MNNRIQKAKANLGENFDAILVSSTANITYLTNFNGFSEQEREAYLLLTKRNNYIFTDGRYSEVASKLNNFKLIEISAIKNFQQRLREICKKEKIKKLAIEENDIKLIEVIQIKKAVKICSAKNLFAELRAIKDVTEIKHIQEACKLGDKVFRYILSEIKFGTTEKKLAKKIQIFILNHDAEISFKPIVAFGENSSSPHHISSDRKLKKNEIVLLDFGVKINNYCSDMTRTVLFGKANSKQIKIYDAVLKSQQKAIEFINHESLIINRKSRQVLKASDVDSVARKYIEDKGFSTIPHSLGHGIGLEVHEKPSLSPKSRDALKQGMIFSIEPGIYLPNIGGVRIEDLFILTKKGLLKMTSANNKLIEL
jgi:Xaa-Pro aminopeptidase